jgi:hypothetical protein
VLVVAVLLNTHLVGAHQVVQAVVALETITQEVSRVQ